MHASETASGSSIAHSAPSFDASCGCSPTAAYTSGWRSASVSAACDVSRSVPTHTIHSTPAARARATCSSPPASCRWQWESTHARPPRHVRCPCGGTAARPSRAVAPAGSCPHAAAVGQPLVLGPAGQPEPAPQLGGRVRDHRRREQRDDAQRLEAVAQHRRDRVRVALLVELPGLGVLDVRVRRADQIPDRAEARSRSRAGSSRRTIPRTRVAAASRSGPSARASGTTPPQ